MNNRELLVKMTVMAELKAVGDYTLGEQQLFAAVFIRLTTPRFRQQEFDECLNELESRRLIIGIEGERDRQWKLTQAGKLWCAENL